MTLAAVMATGPLAVYALSALSPLVIEDLGLTRAQFGLVATTCFVLAAVASRISGLLVDRVGGRSVVVTVCWGAIAGLAILATARSYAWVLVAVALSGVVQALANPATTHLVAAHVPLRHRGSVAGAKQTGVQLSQLLTGATLPAVAVWLTWRGAVGVTVLAVVAVLALTLVALPPPPPRPTERAPAQGMDGRVGSTAPARVWLLAGYSFLVGASLQATNIYLPLFGHEALGLDVARAGYCAALVGGVGLLSRLAWSAAFDRLRRPHLLLVWLAVSGPLGVGAFVVAAETHTSALLWLGAAFHGATTVAASIMVMLVLIRTIEPERVGSTSGIVNTGHFAGYAAGPVAFGWLVDASGSYTLAWAAAAALYLGGAVLALRFPRGPVVPSEEPAAAATPSPAG